MAVLGEVFDTLRTMSQLQLLLAFIAFIGYALAQGALLSPRTRRYAAAAAVISVIGFAFESAQWMYATMLVTFAVAALGLFAAAAWMTSRFLGLSEPRTAVEFAALAESEAASVQAQQLQHQLQQPALIALQRQGSAAPTL